MNPFTSRTSRRLRLTCHPLMTVALLAALSAGCGDSSSPDPQPYPVVWSWVEPGHIGLSLRYLLPVTTANCLLDSVLVSGPALAGSVKLGCGPTTGDAFGHDVDVTLGAPAAPLSFVFTATIAGRTVTQTAVMNCYQAVPAGIAPSPGASVSSPVTLRWLTAAATGIAYSVYLSPVASGTPAGVAMDGDSLRLSLTPGSYLWSVSAEPDGLHDGTSARTCGSSWGQGSFTVN